MVEPFSLDVAALDGLSENPANYQAACLVDMAKVEALDTMGERLHCWAGISPKIPLTPDDLPLEPVQLGASAMVPMTPGPWANP